MGVPIGVPLKEHRPEPIFTVEVRRNYQNETKTTNFAEWRPILRLGFSGICFITKCRFSKYFSDC